MPVGKNGDCYARYIVRMHEIEREHQARPPGSGRHAAPARSWARSLAASSSKATRTPASSRRGARSACYLVGDGTDQAYRLKWRSPCFVHLQLLDPMGRGGLVADMVASIGSIDIVMGEVDR